jgi:starch synthase
VDECKPLDAGHHVEVVVPKYAFFNNSPLLGAMEYETHFEWNGTMVNVTKCKVEAWAYTRSR